MTDVTSESEVGKPIRPTAQ